VTPNQELTDSKPVYCNIAILIAILIFIVLCCITCLQYLMTFSRNIIYHFTKNSSMSSPTFNLLAGALDRTPARQHIQPYRLGSSDGSFMGNWGDDKP